MIAPGHGGQERGGGEERERPVLVMKRNGSLQHPKKREERKELTMKEREVEEDWCLLFS